MPLSKSELIAKVARTPELVPVEGLGEVYVVPLSFAQRRRWSEAILAENVDDTAYTTLLAECLTGEDGTPLFTADEATTLVDGDGQLVQNLFTALLKASGMWEGAVSEAKND